MRILFIIFLLVSISSSAQVLVSESTGTADSKAILELRSNTKGFILPRLTDNERSVLTSSLGMMQRGLMIYDTKKKKLAVWNGNAWDEFENSLTGTEFIRNQSLGPQPANFWINGMARSQLLEVNNGSSLFSVSSSIIKNLVPTYFGQRSVPIPASLSKLYVDSFQITTIPDFGTPKDVNSGIVVNTAYPAVTNDAVIGISSFNMLPTIPNTARQAVNASLIAPLSTTPTTQDYKAIVGVSLAFGFKNNASPPVNPAPYLTTYGVYSSIQQDNLIGNIGNTSYAGYFKNANSIPNSNHYAIYVDGRAALTPGSLWENPSDARLKKNIVTIDNPLEKILNLRGVYYNYKEEILSNPGLSANRNIGFIAQEVKAVVPEAVHEGLKLPQMPGVDYLTISYTDIIPLLVEAIKDQQKQIEELKKILSEIKK